MATFRKRGNLQWEARVRRKGYPTTCKTFEIKADAEAWARSIEAEMDKGAFVTRKEAESTTLGELLQRYLEEKVPSMLCSLDLTLHQQVSVCQFDNTRNLIKYQICK